MSEFESIEKSQIPVVNEQQQELIIKKRFISGAIKSLSKGQDFIAFGEEEEYEWGVLLDGHGKNAFIQLMRQENWREIMTSENPWETLKLILALKKFSYGYGSGSTLLMMRAFSNRIETVSIGDSQIVIYKNQNLVYKSIPHKSDNVSELERLSNRRIRYVDSDNSKMISSKKFRVKISKYTIFENGTKLAPTQAIGHNDITGYLPEMHVEYFTEEDEIRCVLFSDGFGDMFLFESEIKEDLAKDKEDILNMNAEELTEKAEKRWNQQWDWHWDIDKPEIFTVTNFGIIKDDVGIIVWDKKK